MRILAIRGCNLASLAGAFELDMTRGALSRTGLFAITGPTGSGKSTLLDAMCLALFDDTPRLSSAGSTAIGHGANTLSAQDPKSLLRRDAASGFAEVRFEGVDGHRWKARWACRRAKDRAGERPQAQSLELENLDTGERVGGTKTQIKDAITQRLGLTFEQFRRSALLAQGEFAAFLEAKPRERAELLERMTGTEIYATLSIRAFERAKQAEQHLQDLETERRRLGVLSAQERIELDRAIQQAQAHADQAEAAWTQVQAAHAAQQQRQQLQQVLASRQQQQADAQAALQAPWIQELAQARQLEALRPVLDQLDAARAQTVAQGADLGPLQDAVRSAQAAWQARAQEREAAETRREQAGPILDQAAALDGRIATLQADLEARQRAANQAQAEATAAEQALRTLDQRQQSAAQDRDTATAWLAQHDDQALVQAWRHGARVDLERWLQWMDERRKAEARLDALPLQPLDDALKVATDSAQDAATALETARQHHDLVAGREGPDLERLAQLQQHASLARQGRKQHDDLAELDDELRQLADATAERHRRRDQLAQDLQRWTQTANRLAAAARQAADASLLARHRQALVHGEPCPVCGATEHPAADDPLDQLSQDLQQQADDASDRRQQLGEQLARLEQALSDAATTRTELQKRRDATRTQLDQTLAEWALPGSPLDDPTALNAELTSLQRQVQSFGDLKDQVRQAQAHVRQAETDAQAAIEARHQAQNARTARIEQRAAIQRELERAEGHIQSEAADLDGRLPAGWRERAALNGAKALERYEQRVQAWETHAQRLAEATAVLDDHARRQAQETAGHARRLADEKSQALDAVQTTLQDARAERQGLLDGQPTASAREALATAERQAEAAESAARTKLDEAVARLSEARKEAAGAQALATAASQRLRQLEQALQDQLQGQTEAQVRAALRTKDWVDARSTQLEQLRDQATRAAARTQETADQLQALVVPEQLPDLAQAQAHRADAQKALTRLTVQREEDDAAHAQAEALVDQLDHAHRERMRWQTLSKLIGSAKGDTFRTFAQGLTLTTLLAHANQQLQQLAPRYTLQRIPGKDLDFQVMDTAMGDEIRSIASLSGGETFMVSLALALGLSSMASRQTRVDTLFIDEGFGSLDQATLHTAISTLEALHQGRRKVGVISHVQGLAERIDVRVEVVRLAPGRSTLRIHGD